MYVDIRRLTFFANLLKKYTDKCLDELHIQYFIDENRTLNVKLRYVVYR